MCYPVPHLGASRLKRPDRVRKIARVGRDGEMMVRSLAYLCRAPSEVVITAYVGLPHLEICPSYICFPTIDELSIVMATNFKDYRFGWRFRFPYNRYSPKLATAEG